MKKTLFAFTALAAAFAVTSCQNNEELSLEPTDPQTDRLMVTTGTAKAKIGESEVDVNWVQLWAGGPKFAEYNVGAANKKAEDYGVYYCWGSNIDTDSKRAYKIGTDALTGNSDTATNLWGSNWRMPTREELEALVNDKNCTCTWTTQNSVEGLLCTGRGAYSSNSVFLPAAGGCFYGYVFGQDYYGYYWSSTPDGSLYAYYLNFYSGRQYVDDDGRDRGYSVRAVLNESAE